MSNPCPRCGKERIILKQWSEEIKVFGGVSVVTNTQTVCPDKNCQKILEKKQAELREKSDEIKRNVQRRAEERLKNRAELKFQKDKEKSTKKSK